MPDHPSNTTPPTACLGMSAHDLFAITAAPSRLPNPRGRVLRQQPRSTPTPSAKLFLFVLLFPNQNVDPRGGRSASNMFTHPKMCSFMYAYALPPEGKSSRRSLLEPKKSCKRVKVLYVFVGGGKKLSGHTFPVTLMWKPKRKPPKSLGRSQLSGR